MKRAVTTVVDVERCIGCGDCVRVCPSGTLELVDGIAQVTGAESLNCGHCQAVCPEEAIRVESLDPDAQAYTTFTPDSRWLPFGEPDTAQLVRLLASRRSCRNYTEQPVARALLDDLVRAGMTAPSGTNSQRWSFTLLPTRAAMLALGEQILRFFTRVNQLASSAALRHGLRLLRRPELDRYYREHYHTVAEAMDEWREGGRDRLFHGATASIVIGARPGASLPTEDALLAAQNILLTAHSMGLGTCLVGYVVEAARRDRAIARAIGVPDEEALLACVALGHPNEAYQRTAGRLFATRRVFEPDAQTLGVRERIG